MFTPTCTAAPPSTPGDAGIAGTRVLLCFILTATAAMTISTTLVLHDMRQEAASQHDGHETTDASAGPTTTAAAAAPPFRIPLAAVGRRLLGGYADQQIVAGIGLQALGLARARRLVPYHLGVVWLLGLLSSAVHNAALLADRDRARDVRRARPLRWLRQALMLAHGALSWAVAGCLLRVLYRGLPPTLPAACAWRADTRTVAPVAVAGPLPYVATVAVMLGHGAVFVLATWYLQSSSLSLSPRSARSSDPSLSLSPRSARSSDPSHSPRSTHPPRPRYYRIAQVSALVLMIAVAVGVATRLLMTTQAYGGTPSVQLADLSETRWGFGQIFALLMLVLPLVSAAEMARGAIQEATSPEGKSDDGDVCLVGLTAA